MCKNGLRLSPKKCQLFKTQLTYMGNEFSINKRTMTITPLRSRTEAINKIPTPKTPKQCKSFCGVVNYLSLFFPDLQKLLKPIVKLTRKGKPFMWGEAQEKAFRERERERERETSDLLWRNFRSVDLLRKDIQFLLWTKLLRKETNCGRAV